MTEITQADRDAAAMTKASDGYDLEPKLIRQGECDHWNIVEAFARHRMEERAAIVAWLRGETGCAWSRDVIEAAHAIEAGDHLK